MQAIKSPQAWYAQAREQGFVADAAQENAIAALEQSFSSLQQHNYAQASLYLWGPVGRGKTWLMDNFYSNLSVPARRQHFHHFMRWLHRRLNELVGTANPLQTIAKQLASEIRVLCFDEVFVNDIADAVLLGSVFQTLFESGITLLMTSNQAPNDLYLDGFNREAFLPAIAAIQSNMRVVPVDGGQDHRLHAGETEQRYWVQTDVESSRLPQVFQQLSGQQAQAGRLSLSGRPLEYLGAANRVLFCDFSALCLQPFSALDFIELCDQFDSVLLANVPCLTADDAKSKIARGTEDAVYQVKAGDRQLPQLTRFDDAVRRFIALIDECYDRRVLVYIEAEVALDALYTKGYLAFAFRRALSRLQEMQLRRFAQTGAGH